MGAIDQRVQKMRFEERIESSMQDVAVCSYGYENQEARRVELRSGSALELVFIPTMGSREALLEAAFLTSISHHSDLANAIFACSIAERGRELRLPKGSQLISSEQGWGAHGIDLKERSFRQGDLESVENWIQWVGGRIQMPARRAVSLARRRGHAAVIVADQRSDLGVIEVL